MMSERYNREGYPDPTYYEAVSRIESEARRKRQAEQTHGASMPKVYICSPYAGDVNRNVHNARRYCRFAVEQGCIPYAPHLFFPQFLDDGDSQERRSGLFMGLVWLGGCREMWVFGRHISSGMSGEIAYAKQKHMKIRYFGTNCKEVRHELS